MARILFIGIDYYAYVAEICAAFERIGNEIDYFPLERTGFWHKTLKKFAPRTYRRWLDAYHRRIIDLSARKRYDTILFIQCHHISHENMVLLRDLHKDARFVLYNWDSLATHDFRPWLGHFDKALTFDPVDAASLGIGYLPLFAIPAYFAARHRSVADFDIYFVGSVGTLERFDALARLKEFCDEQGISTCFHLKCSPVVRLMLLRRGKRLPGLTFVSLDHGRIIDLIERSRATFDFANHRQSGYTMRFIENMCAGQKIVTDNVRVIDEPFYRPDRFLALENLDFSNLREFLDRKIETELDTRRWSIESWANQLVDR